MMSLDPFYTPPEIAKKMIGCVQDSDMEYIADFAAGNGELLRAARSRWPKSQFVASDVCRKTVSRLRHNEPEWLIGRCNFLEASSRNRCKTIKKLKGKVALALLNPPFSCRGGTLFSVSFNGDTVRCSQALAFVLQTIPFVTKKGQIVAILPAGCLQSEKDEMAWNLLDKFCKINIECTNGNRTFRNCSAKTAIVSFTISSPENVIKEKHKIINKVNLNSTNKIEVKIYRGKVMMYTISKKTTKNWLPFIHTTDLKGKNINLSQQELRKVDERYKGIIGPAVLLPRVGKPSESKILVYRDRYPIVLSDCVMALKCKTVNDAQKIRSILIKNWPTVKRFYTGTCAKYITIKALTHLLRIFEIQVIY